MAQTTTLILVAASALVCFTALSSRDDGKDSKSDVLVSVSPTSFSRISESPSSGNPAEAKTSVLAELSAQPAGEPSHEAAMLVHAKEHPAANVNDASSLSADDAAAAASWKAGAQSTMQVAKAAAGLSAIGDSSKALRKAVAELGLDIGLEEGDLKAAATSKRRLEAVAKLHDYARESHHARQTADALDEEMKVTYARLTAKQANKENAAANADEHQNSVEAQLIHLDKETEHVMGMFDKIKQLRAVGEEMQTSRASILKEAAASGLSADEIKMHLKMAHEKAKAIAEISPSLAAEGAIVDGTDEGQAEQKEQLRNLLASSAIEMAQIESAAGEVIDGLNAVTALKLKQDDSHISPAEAASVKARLAKAVRFLEEHENLVAERSKQINALMAKAHMGSLNVAA